MFFFTKAEQGTFSACRRKPSPPAQVTPLHRSLAFPISFSPGHAKLERFHNCCSLRSKKEAVIPPAPAGRGRHQRVKCADVEGPCIVPSKLFCLNQSSQGNQPAPACRGWCGFAFRSRAPNPSGLPFVTLRSLREQGSEKSLDCECIMLPLICCDVFDGIGAELCLDFDAGSQMHRIQRP